MVCSLNPFQQALWYKCCVVMWEPWLALIPFCSIKHIWKIAGRKNFIPDYKKSTRRSGCKDRLFHLRRLKSVCMDKKAWTG